MKKILPALLLFSLIACLFGCAKQEKEPADLDVFRNACKEHGFTHETEYNGNGAIFFEADGSEAAYIISSTSEEAQSIADSMARDNENLIEAADRVEMKENGDYFTRAWVSSGKYLRIVTYKNSVCYVSVDEEHKNDAKEIFKAIGF